MKVVFWFAVIVIAGVLSWLFMPRIADSVAIAGFFVVATLLLFWARPRRRSDR